MQLFTYRNPGEDINQAVSANGSQPYTALPNAFKYRQSWNNACSCRKAGESWAQTLKNIDDTTVEQGDIVVDEQRAKQMSQPRGGVQGKPTTPPPPRTTAPQRPGQAKPQRRRPCSPLPSARRRPTRLRRLPPARMPQPRTTRRSR